MKNKLAPIVLFVYNRLWHTQQTIEALQKNKLATESEIFIYSDASKNSSTKIAVDEVRAYIKSIDGFKKITLIEREKNWGLAESIIDGVTSIINQFGKIIVLEDDLVTSPYFLKFMNDSLEMYQNEKKVISIHGYVYPIKNLANTFFIKGADCWGWATWKRAWDIFEPNGSMLLDKLQLNKLQKEADFNNSYSYSGMLSDQINGLNNSWAVRWYMSAFLKNMLTLYPGKSFIDNIGNDNSGTHCISSRLFEGQINTQYKVQKITIVEDLKARKKFEVFFNSSRQAFIKRLINQIKNWICNVHH